MKPADHLSLYAARRSRLAALMGEGVAVIATAPERLRNRDSHYPYRFDSYFYYLTGFIEPDAVLVLVAGKPAKSVLFCRNRNLMGALTNRRITTVAAFVVAAVIVCLNVFLLVQTFAGLT